MFFVLASARKACTIAVQGCRYGASGTLSKAKQNKAELVYSCLDAKTKLLSRFCRLQCTSAVLNLCVWRGVVRPRL